MRGRLREEAKCQAARNSKEDPGVLLYFWALSLSQAFKTKLVFVDVFQFLSGEDKARTVHFQRPKLLGQAIPDFL